MPMVAVEVGVLRKANPVRVGVLQHFLVGIYPRALKAEAMLLFIASPRYRSRNLEPRPREGLASEHPELAGCLGKMGQWHGSDKRWRGEICSSLMSTFLSVTPHQHHKFDLVHPQLTTITRKFAVSRLEKE